ncbi:hypothetical protein LCGC14_2790230, partial [marine sediment metagenome]
MMSVEERCPPAGPALPTSLDCCNVKAFLCFRGVLLLPLSYEVGEGSAELDYRYHGKD